MIPGAHDTMLFMEGLVAGIVLCVIAYAMWMGRDD